MFLGIIFFLELTAGVLAFVFKDWIKDQLNFFINNNIRAYRDDIDLQNLIDFTQEYVRGLQLCHAFLLFCCLLVSHIPPEIPGGEVKRRKDSAQLEDFFISQRLCKTE